MSDAWRLTKHEQWLCDCVQISDPQRAATAARHLLNAIGEESAFELANTNEIAPHVAHALGKDAATRFRAKHDSTQQRLDIMLAELDRIADVLANLGIPVVALKNAGIARGLHGCRGCNPMGDLDLLVRKSDFRRAHQALVADGYTFQFRSDLEEENLESALVHGGSEYFKVLPGGYRLWVELQWRPVAGRWLQKAQEPHSDELMQRSIPIPGTRVRLLSPEDNLLQVALHTAKHTYVRAPGFRLHTDVDRIVASQPIDWDLFVTRVRRLHLRTATYFSLRMASELLGTPVPRAVLTQLQPSWWKRSLLTRWIRTAGVFDPTGRKFTRTRYILFVTLLYDRAADLLRGLLPPPAQVLKTGQSAWSLPAAYGRRILDLALRRHHT